MSLMIHYPQSFAGIGFSIMTGSATQAGTGGHASRRQPRWIRCGCPAFAILFLASVFAGAQSSNANFDQVVASASAARDKGNVSQAIDLYQEGDRLKRHCEARLKDAQARIEQIAFGADGKPAGLKPFDAD